MGDEEKVTEEEQVSEEKEEQVSEEKVDKESTKEPTPEEKIAKLISEKVAEEITKQTEASKREIQSVKDKAKAEVESAQRRARLAEGIDVATQTHMKELDPETLKDFELARLRAESQGRLSLEQEDQARRQQESYGKALSDSLHDHLGGLGIDPNDERIDWAEDSADYVSGRRRFDTSVAKIIKEKESASRESVVKEITAKIKADLGVEDANSVETTVSGGVSKSGIPTDIIKFQKWVDELPQEEYEKLKPEVDKMMAEGKIK